jgi:integral membrane protein
LGVDSFEQNLYKNFLLVGHLEGISFLLLLGIAMPIKYLLHFPPAVTIAGSIHGILFIAFCSMIYNMYRSLKWTKLKCAKALLLGFLPFGTFFLEKLK